MRPGKAMLAMGFALVLAAKAHADLPSEGTLEHSDLFGGPAVMLSREVVLAPGTILGWHFHPGVLVQP